MSAIIGACRSGCRGSARPYSFIAQKIATIVYSARSIVTGSIRAARTTAGIAESSAATMIVTDGRISIDGSRPLTP